MKLSPLQSINFGYDKAYHNYVQDELSKAKHDKELAHYLLECDKLSLQIEDEVLFMEKSPKKINSKNFITFTQYLTDLKTTIAYYMSLFFDELRYPETLAQNYSDEIDNEPDTMKQSWRDSIASSMRNYVDIKYLNDNYSSQNKKSVEKEKKHSDTDSKSTPENSVNTGNKSADADAQLSAASDYLEEYIPHANSPKGFSDVVGMDNVKLKLKESIIDYTQNPEQAKQDFEEYGISSPRGFLFYGHPGCGKTYITRALAAESGLDMFMLDVSKVGSKYVNQTSNNLQAVFDYLKERAANTAKPILLFMDEVDSLAMSRGNIAHSAENMKTVSTILKLVEEAKENNIIVIAATNKYDLLDDAFKARFDGQIYFPVADEKEIEALLKFLLSKRSKGIKLSQSSEEIKELAKILKGHSNRSITFIVEEASKIAKRRNRDNISFNDIKQASDTTELEKTKEKDYNKASKVNRMGFISEI